ncbi:MAG: hypothetical protein A2172_00405 [Candidatus Woykebacteria bacterium RBG_13_40_15]|uniref:Uncharacterized protein n=1 Tax=Candidatus Woykebacteria bacterium RBG_13_40_15 TaxID=1802593 RepID=A0A1G1W9K9_9BACT|nr:MAG: hypothetical protein A2172_00405 [Candidatus Woykebacteria bacterium RBG_13_40_15]
MDGEIPSMGESEAQEIESQEEAEARESEVKPMTLDIPRVEESASREKGPYQMDVVEKEPGVFRVLRETLTNEEQPDFAFSKWDDDVEDLDAKAGDFRSDISQLSGMSNHLRMGEVDLTPREYHAPSIDLLKEALTHVEFGTFDPGDI